MNDLISPSNGNKPTLFLKKYMSLPPPLFFKEINEHGGVIRSSNGYWICLRYSHTFGRSINCHTVLISPDSYHMHFTIFWKKENWYILDVSKQGTWLNKKRLVKDKPYLIKKADIITLSLNAEEQFVMTNDLPPCDILISLAPDICPIYLKKPVTPLSEHCFFLYDLNGWNVNTSENNQEKSHEIHDGEVIKLFDNHYYLQYAQERCGQEKRVVSRSIDELTFCFYVSEDEEDIQLQITDIEQSITLKGERLQNQLYLLLHLARKSMADHLQGYAQSHRGWCDLNSLSKALGIKPNNTRIRVHRLRHRLCDAVNFTGIDACQILQIKDASVRIYPSKITIIKGGKIE
ncbi:FHA domain-containing protein [Pectobacterium aquaticum]|uniref:FHA domain-containing protein n=1 Tax=Pectobacterium aquaticum TaxID=2204145 RepID=UPI000E2480AC|nr:FHA domain-containing protein [Pectobacterium aquaticum]RRO09121.1 FHA domain-containing protein [Pectobacterium aquaticum]